jgi:hypothetical protein
MRSGGKIALTRKSPTTMTTTPAPPPPLMSVENGDLALSPNYLSSMGNALGRFLARGAPSSLEDRFHAVYDPDIQDDAVVAKVDIRKIRDVMSDITTRPCKSRNSPKTVHRYQSPSCS